MLKTLLHVLLVVVSIVGDKTYDLSVRVYRAHGGKKKAMVGTLVPDFNGGNHMGIAVYRSLHVEGRIESTIVVLHQPRVPIILGILLDLPAFDFVPDRLMLLQPLLVLCKALLLLFPRRGYILRRKICRLCSIILVHVVKIRLYLRDPVPVVFYPVVDFAGCIASVLGLDRTYLGAVDRLESVKEPPACGVRQLVAAIIHEKVEHLADFIDIVLPEVGYGPEVGAKPPHQPPDLNIYMALPRQLPRGPYAAVVSIKIELHHRKGVE